MKKKKKRPLFPGGYKKKNKVIKKPYKTGKQEVIEILTAAKSELQKRLKFNKGVEIEDYLKDVFSDKWVNKEITEINKQLKLLKTKNIRPRKQSIELFKELYTIVGQQNDYGLIVNNRETSFKHMILIQLKNQGVDILNPNALNKALNGHSVSDLYKLWQFELNNNPTVAETFYEKLAEGYKDFINELLTYKKSYNKMAKASKLLKEIQ